MRIGGHVSIAGSLAKAVEREQTIGGNCGQIFFSGPTAWRLTEPNNGQLEDFITGTAAADVAPWIVHAIYLINLAAEDERIWQASIGSLQAYRSLGARAGVLGVVAHTGTHRGAGLDAVLPRVVAALEAILAPMEGGPRLLLEACAGQGGAIGCRFEELATLIEALGNDERLGVCWDTCHLLAAGYDLTSREGVERTLAEFDDTVGLSRLVAVHANDSRYPLGSHKDRHANIGEGHIGEDGFACLLEQPVLRTLPWVLETPGTERSGPDLTNINRLRRLAGLEEVTMPEGDGDKRSDADIAL